MSAASAPGSSRNPFRPEIFFSPAGSELVHRLGSVPRILSKALREYARHPQDLTLLESLMSLTQALPVGLFDNEPVRRYLADLITIIGSLDGVMGGVDR